MKEQDLSVLKQRFHSHVRELQDKITKALFSSDPKLTLTEDIWERSDFKQNPGGGGITRAFSGDVIENAGVNTSEVFGAIDPEFAKRLGGTGDEMWAAGISLIIHPRNPRIPTVHANFRMIVAGEKFWFGGGADLTPFYPHEDDFRYFHHVWKKACAPYGLYEKMKKDCDTYFVNAHRKHELGAEMRGIGGIFFDHYNTMDTTKDFDMVVDLSNHFIESYFPIVDKRKSEVFTEADEDFQLHRRGRYVEFNLLHDRGTMFGLKTNGRTDSILISLPARAKFTYRYQPPKGSIHEKMMANYFPKDWA